MQKTLHFQMTLLIFLYVYAGESQYEKLMNRASSKFYILLIIVQFGQNYQIYSHEYQTNLVIDVHRASEVREFLGYHLGIQVRKLSEHDLIFLFGFNENFIILQLFKNSH